MSFAEVHSALMGFIERPLATALPPGSQVSWPNGPAIAGTSESGQPLPWAATALTFDSAEIPVIGRRMALHRGQLQIMLAWPVGSGEGDMLDAADSLAGALKNQTVAGAIRLGLPSLLAAASEDAWNRQVLSLPWNARLSAGVASDLLAGYALTWAGGASALRVPLAALIGGQLGLPVAFGNAPAESLPVQQDRVFVDVVSGAEVPRQAGEPIDAARLGALQIQTEFPLGTGAGASLEALDVIAGALEQQSARAIQTGAARITSQRPSAGGWQTTLQVPFAINSEA